MTSQKGTEMRETDDVDLKYLFHRQQVERTRADEAASNEARKAHEGMARGYEDEITRATHGNILFPHGDEPEDEAA